MRKIDRGSYCRRALGKLESPLGNASGILVLLEHQGYEFHVIDWRDLDLPDPPVWLVVEGKSAATHWPSVTDWFRFGAPNLMDYKFRLEFSRKRRRVVNPSWLRYFDFSTDRSNG
ncbi:hypothetical protein ACFYUD_10850 [Nocardia tengchongensis]|uniref:hypothetical protein n=1 Tax=Nocardia tengchongensis TaxID=2055889 RepID=UPI00368C76A8